MKNISSHTLSLALILSALGLMGGNGLAQTFQVLHHFAGSDGNCPYGALIVSGETLYGTTKDGGASGVGTVFRMKTDGGAFTNLHSFTPLGTSFPINEDGAYPYSPLLLIGDVLYGTAYYSGPEANGTIFKLKTDGSGFAVMYDFPYPDHGSPYGELILSENTLYGTTGEGGPAGAGSVFALQTDGTGYTNFHSFSYSAPSAFSPQAGLLLSDNTLYATTLFGGTGGYGTVFKVQMDGSGYADLHHFTRGLDGANPECTLVLVSNALYGTTSFGGAADKGVVFKVNTDGTGFTNLHSFMGGWNEAYCDAGLVLMGNSLYGITYMGGNGNRGTVFRINLDGSGFTNIHHFTGTADGANPHGALVVSGNTIYGTASAGGSSSCGTIFSISFPAPTLTVSRSGTNVVLTWPASSGLTLRSATELDASDWPTVSPNPVVINGQNVVTNPASGSRRFYRLRN